MGQGMSHFLPYFYMDTGTFGIENESIIGEGVGDGDYKIQAELLRTELYIKTAARQRALS